MATTPHIISSSTTLTFLSPQTSIFPQPFSFLNLSTTKNHRQNFPTTISQPYKPPVNAVSTTNSTPLTTTSKFYGLCYVVGDDVNTDQIIPEAFNGLNPKNPEDFQVLGSNAFVGLQPNSYAIRFIDGGFKSKYSIVIAGENFGCGPSKEVAGVALNAAGTRAVIAESFDGSFLKNLGFNGELLLGLESEIRVCDEFKTGDVATIDVAERMLINRTTGKVFLLKNVGDYSDSL